MRLATAPRAARKDVDRRLAMSVLHRDLRRCRACLDARVGELHPIWVRQASSPAVTGPIRLDT